MADDPAPTDDDPALTFGFEWTRAGLASERAVNSTLHRHLSSVSPDVSGLPSLRVGGDDPQAFVEQERLGEGGMGVVHAARDGVLERTVAIKRPRGDIGGRASGALVAEARTLAALDHPNVVPVHQLGCDDHGAPVLVMKRVRGRRWSEVVAEGVDLDRDIRVMLEVCDALSYAHALGLLHRDVKPDNIMVGGFGEVYLMDWGCACSFLEDAVTTEVVGTPACMAPEMVQVGARISPRTDVFLLGACMHQALLGHPRHAGANLREVLAAAVRPHPYAYPDAVPAELADILNRACARDPAERPESAEAFALALRGFLAHRGAVALSRRASTLLGDLEAAVIADEARAEVLFAECRFGFRGALDAWAGCEEARVGLARAFAAWIPWKLRQGELGAVEAVLPELDPAEARRWTAELERVRERRAREAAALRAADVSVAARERQWVMLGILVTAVGTTAFMLGTRSPDEILPRDLVALALFGCAIVSVWVWLFRARVMANRVSRGFVGSVFVTLGASVMIRIGGWVGGTLPADTLRADAVCYAAVVAVTAFTVDGWLVLAALPHLLAAVAISAWPEAATLWFPLGLVASLAAAVAVLVRRARLSAATED